jgi:shikimate dehydrogenase
VIGDPIEHSLSPALHNWVLERLGLNYEYRAFHVPREKLARFFQDVRAGQIGGLNVTIPHKEAVIALLDGIEPEAARLGAVNTIVRTNGAWRGFNTDGLGFLRAMSANGIRLRGARVVLLGAGGSAKAVAFALAQSGIAHLVIYNRSVERAESLRRQLSIQMAFTAVHVHRLSDGDCWCEDLSRATLCVNSTPVGMYPKTDQSPLAVPEALHRELVVCDLVYNPIETTLMREARHRGVRAFNGLDMLIYQGLESLRLWLGERDLALVKKRISVSELREVLRAKMGAGSV